MGTQLVTLPNAQEKVFTLRLNLDAWQPRKLSNLCRMDLVSQLKMRLRRHILRSMMVSMDLPTLSLMHCKRFSIAAMEHAKPLLSYATQNMFSKLPLTHTCTKEFKETTLSMISNFLVRQ